MQAVPPYPEGKVVVRRLVLAVLPKVGMAKGARIALESTLDGTTATLLLGNMRVSRVTAGMDDLSAKDAPKFVRQGRDWFLVFWTYCATEQAQNYVRLGPRKLDQAVSFESGWSPDFPGNGVVYGYPRSEAMSLSRHRGYGVWIQRKWRWSAVRQRFVRVGDTFLSTMPPVPRHRYTGLP